MTRVATLLSVLIVANCGITRSVVAEDAAAGADIFQRSCANCHEIGERAKPKVGPALRGIVGREAGSSPGFSYSKAAKMISVTWTEENLKDFIRDPRAFMPGTNMAFAGVRDEGILDALIGYLKEVR